MIAFDNVFKEGEFMQVKLNVEGMMCGNCEARLTRVLTVMEGVETVVASHQEGTVVIDFDATKVNESALKEAVEDAGFDLV